MAVRKVGRSRKRAQLICGCCAPQMARSTSRRNVQSVHAQDQLTLDRAPFQDGRFPTGQYEASRSCVPKCGNRGPRRCVGLDLIGVTGSRPRPAHDAARLHPRRPHARRPAAAADRQRRLRRARTTTSTSTTTRPRTRFETASLTMRRASRRRTSRSSASTSRTCRSTRSRSTASPPRSARSTRRPSLAGGGTQPMKLVITPRPGS